MAEPASTGTQITFAIKLGAAVCGLIFILWMCLRDNVRGAFLSQPTFEVGQTIELPYQGGAMQVGDFDGDGLDDLFLNLDPRHSPHFEVWLNRDGVFSPEHRWILTDTFTLLDMDAGDVDGDGLADLIGTSTTQRARIISLWRNRGDGRFDREQINAALQYVDLADNDGDGDLDLFGVTRDFAEIHILENPGNGDFSAPPIVQDDLNDNTVRGIEAGNLDGGTGDVALLAFNTDGGRIRLLRNGGFIPDLTSHFNQAPGWVEGKGLGFDNPSYALEDINGDDRPDLVVIENGAPTAHLSIEGADFAPLENPIPSPPAKRLLVGEINGDGRADLITLSTDEMRLTVLLGTR